MTAAFPTFPLARFRQGLVCGLLLSVLSFTAAKADPASPPAMQDKAPSPADRPPRKVIVGTVLYSFRGDVPARLADAVRLIDEAAGEAAREYPGRGLDLLVLPEHAVMNGQTPPASLKAVPLEGPVLETFAAKAREHHTYIVLPIIMREEDGGSSNAGVLLDRAGKVAGIYHKVHPVRVPDGTLEWGITPGGDFPVFDCDFGKVGIQICFDIAYEDGWLALARAGAEIIAVPSASPQTVKPASYALRGGVYVVTSTPRDNVTIFNPIGLVAAQSTDAPVLVREIDLSYAILHWVPGLDNGQALTAHFGDRVGYQYSEREDTGVFWSNDPRLTIGGMVRELGLPRMEELVGQSLELRERARGR